jgi:hypothetical protein
VWSSKIISLCMHNQWIFLYSFFCFHTFSSISSKCAALVCPHSRKQTAKIPQCSELCLGNKNISLPIFWLAFFYDFIRLGCLCKSSQITTPQTNNVCLESLVFIPKMADLFHMPYHPNKCSQLHTKSEASSATDPITLNYLTVSRACIFK